MTKPKIKKEKDIIRVLDALRSGENTSKYISNVTGISTKAVSAYLGELVKCGLAKVENRRGGYWRENRQGSLFYIWRAL